MKTLFFTVMVCAVLAPVLAENLPPAPLPIPLSQVADLPREESAWSYKWGSKREFVVVRIVTQCDPEQSRGFSVVEVHHPNMDVSELALAYPGHEPRVDDRVYIMRMQLKTPGDEGPFFTFTKEKEPSVE